MNGPARAENSLLRNNPRSDRSALRTRPASSPARHDRGTQFSRCGSMSVHFSNSAGQFKTTVMDAGLVADPLIAAASIRNLVPSRVTS